jgi:hypothetical protein
MPARRGKPPWGYTVKDGEYVIVRQEAEIIGLLFQRVAMGAPVRDTADELGLSFRGATRILHRRDYAYGELPIVLPETYMDAHTTMRRLASRPSGGLGRRGRTAASRARRTTLGVAAALVALVLAIGAILVFTEADDPRPVDAINSACATVTTRFHGSVADLPDSHEVARVARESAADVRALRLPSGSRAPELTAALTAYADTQASAGGGDALIDPVATANGLDEVRRRLDRVAAWAQAPSCAPAALAPDPHAALP